MSNPLDDEPHRPEAEILLDMITTAPPGVDLSELLSHLTELGEEY